MEGIDRLEDRGEEKRRARDSGIGKRTVIGRMQAGAGDARRLFCSCTLRRPNYAQKISLSGEFDPGRRAGSSCRLRQTVGHMRLGDQGHRSLLLGEPSLALRRTQRQTQTRTRWPSGALPALQN